MTCFEPLEADLAHYYQTDLTDALWGPAPLSARRLSALVKGLPPGSAVGRELSAGWGVTEELLATLIEVVDRGDRWFYSAHSPPGARMPEPLVIPRPGQRPAPPAAEAVPAGPRRTSSPEQIRAAGGRFIHAPVPGSKKVRR